MFSDNCCWRLPIIKKKERNMAPQFLEKWEPKTGEYLREVNIFSGYLNKI